MSTLLSIITANILISCISLIGLSILSVKTFASKKLSTFFVSFAAGVLLATSILNILPESLEHLPTQTALSWFMYGIIAAFLLERSLLWYHHHHEDTHDINPTSLLVLVGDAIHNLIDGLSIAAAFIVSPALGIATTIAIAAHEIPQEIADYSILRHCGMGNRRAILWNFVSALTAVIGGIIGFYIFRESFELLHYALAVTAGIFLYVSAADLIPELHHSHTSHSWLPQTVLFLAGVVLIILLSGLGPAH
ncbi:ZIP family metal transporter [Candidatus Woesebacteria bacterium]|nr:ZIP family metal transporter [Candidatus Woesebacteria bacterium]